MCGITGIFAYNLVGKFHKINVTEATRALHQRGPDFQDVHLDEWVCLGHRRLSIIDTREVAHQPMWDESKRFCLIFNGEIFNYKLLRAQLEAKGVRFTTESDTEVLLNLLIQQKENALNQLNGFFAFAFYDKHEQTLLVARDRYGIKPLLYISDDDKFIFASEMKSILAYGVDKEIDMAALATYLQLNYIPAPNTIFSKVKKLMPGHYAVVKKGVATFHRYYSIPYSRELNSHAPISYAEAQAKLRALLEASVQRRLVADVPLGAFLSGGIDSSIISAIASRHQRNLHTFSIGFRDEKFFDETHYARLVAKKLNTQHTVFSLTNQDLYAHMNNILNYIDEPFADSSAIAVYILSKETRKHATVALSGDGADELFAGYHKHAAFYQTLQPGWREKMIEATGWLWEMLPKSRGGKLSNLFRQLHRFSEGMRLNSAERYWRWASFASTDNALRLLSDDAKSKLVRSNVDEIKDRFTSFIPANANLNDVLLADMHLVLPNDMLTKVDLMSMANSLEVRVPFLDYEVVNFAFTLPQEFKLNRHQRKRILQDAYRDELPEELYNRPKKGFEVPLLKWLRHEMKSLIEDDLLSAELVKAQGIFDWEEVDRLKRQLFSSNPGDVHARIWGLVVFQWWWKKYVMAASS